MFSTRPDTREEIMTAARATVEKDGYNALSFRDIAKDIGVKSSSIHYYFPTKGDLAQALVERYREDVLVLLEPLNEKSYDEAIGGYIGLFRSFFDQDNRMCLGGMMSAEVTALPEPATAEIKEFMSVHIGWISGIIAKKNPRQTAEKRLVRARAIFAALEGALLISRGVGGDQAVFDEIIGAYRAAGLLG